MNKPAELDEASLMHGPSQSRHIQPADLPMTAARDILLFPPELVQFPRAASLSQIIIIRSTEYETNAICEQYSVCQADEGIYCGQAKATPQGYRGSIRAVAQAVREDAGLETAKGDHREGLGNRGVENDVQIFRVHHSCEDAGTEGYADGRGEQTGSAIPEALHPATGQGFGLSHRGTDRILPVDGSFVVQHSRAGVLPDDGQRAEADRRLPADDGQHQGTVGHGGVDDIGQRTQRRKVWKTGSFPDHRSSVEMVSVASAEHERVGTPGQIDAFLRSNGASYVHGGALQNDKISVREGGDRRQPERSAEVLRKQGLQIDQGRRYVGDDPSALITQYVLPSLHRRGFGGNAGRAGEVSGKISRRVEPVGLGCDINLSHPRMDFGRRSSAFVVLPYLVTNEMEVLDGLPR